MHEYSVLTDQAKYSNSFPISIQYYFILSSLEKNIAEFNKNILWVK